MNRVIDCRLFSSFTRLAYNESWSAMFMCPSGHRTLTRCWCRCAGKYSYPIIALEFYGFDPRHLFSNNKYRACRYYLTTGNLWIWGVLTLFSGTETGTIIKVSYTILSLSTFSCALWSSHYLVSYGAENLKLLIITTFSDDQKNLGLFIF